MAPDFLIRLLPFAAAAVVVELVWRPSWIGIGMGDLSSQLTFALVATPVAFAAGALGQRWLAFRRGGLSVPSGPGDAWFQAGFYAVNGPIEEAFFRGVIQGGLGALVTPPRSRPADRSRKLWPDNPAVSIAVRSFCAPALPAAASPR